MADLFEDALALRRELAYAASARQPRLGDVALEPVEVELQRLELELGRRGLERPGADDQLGHQAGERLVARRQVGGRRAQAPAQVRGGLAGRRRREVVVDVRLG